MDYAANAVVYLPVAEIKADFRRMCEADGRDSAQVLAARLGVEMPIVELMNEVLFNGMAATEAGERLMARDLVSELRGIDRA